MTELHIPTRRELLVGSGVLFAWACLPKLALAEKRDPRLLVVVLRGGLDGLAAVPPLGDPNWARLRGDFGLAPSIAHPTLPLDNFFALSAAMPNFHRMFKSGNGIVFHATATPYRERSHFDGQDVLESGYAKPGFYTSGWLNRALDTLAPAERGPARGLSAFAIGPIAPLIVRGPAKVLSWSPPTASVASGDTLMRLLDLYRHTDPILATALEERIGLAAVVGAQSHQIRNGKANQGRNVAPIRAFFANSASVAAKFLSHSEGPRIGAISFYGWDTHANEGPVEGILATLLAALDDAFGALETGMGPAWKETVVAVVTEFGRTVHINGTRGTDHGTATTAFLAGGALKGGRVIADWPGLADTQLLAGRDLRPTTDLRAAFKGLLRDHIRVDEADLNTKIFPESSAVLPISGLVA